MKFKNPEGEHGQHVQQNEGNDDSLRDNIRKKLLTMNLAIASSGDG